MQYYTSHKNVSFIQEQMSSPDKLLNLLSNLNKENFQMMFDSIKYQQQVAEIAVKVIIKLKKIIQVVSNINSQILVPDAFEVIVNETCRIIDCDRSSVFLTDYDRQELWTKVAKGTNTIRVSLSKGLVGHVATKGETLNILDAHKDYRFNRDVDKKTNYKTKSVLCVPIFDKNRINIVGVLQAINKNNQTFFSKDDEGLIHIMAAVSQQLLRNSMFNDQNQSFQQNLRSLLSLGFKLNRFKTVEELIPQAEYLLSKTFDIPECRIYLFDEKQNKLVRYISSSDTKEFDINIGLVGECFTQGYTVGVSNAYSHNKFNNLIDINTSMPVTCLPIYAIRTSTSKIKIGVITVINQKGIEGISYRMNQSPSTIESNKNVNSIKPGVASTFEETVSTFGQIVSQIVVNIQKLNLDDF